MHDDEPKQVPPPNAADVAGAEAYADADAEPATTGGAGPAMPRVSTVADGLLARLLAGLAAVDVAPTRAAVSGDAPASEGTTRAPVAMDDATVEPAPVAVSVVAHAETTGVTPDELSHRLRAAAFSIAARVLEPPTALDDAAADSDGPAPAATEAPAMIAVETVAPVDDARMPLAITVAEVVASTPAMADWTRELADLLETRAAVCPDVAAPDVQSLPVSAAGETTEAQLPPIAPPPIDPTDMPEPASAMEGERFSSMIAAAAHVGAIAAKPEVPVLGEAADAQAAAAAEGLALPEGGAEAPLSDPPRVSLSDIRPGEPWLGPATRASVADTLFAPPVPLSSTDDHVTSRGEGATAAAPPGDDARKLPLKMSAGDVRVRAEPAGTFGEAPRTPPPHAMPARDAEAVAPPSPVAPRQRFDWRALARKTVRFVAIGFALWFAVTLAAIALFRFVDPPGSMLMLSQRLGGGEVDQRWVALPEISPQVVRAVVASEDGRFCRHWGIDPREIVAAIERARDGVPRGASTITMQVAKNLFLWPSKSYVRKALELPLTLAIELMWSKARILEVYLNIAEWGPGVFGIESAARYHFSKPARSLSRAEAALLAVSLPNPISRDAGDPGGGLRRLARMIEARTLNDPAAASCVLGLRR